MNTQTGNPFPLEELLEDAPSSAREAFVERSAAFEAGDLVRLMREGAGLTQKELAQRVSTSQSHLSEVERGNGLQGPTFSMLRKIAHACEVDLRIEPVQTFGLGFDDMTAEQRKAFAEGLGVAEKNVNNALIAARDKALAILGMAYLEQVVKATSQPGWAYQYAKWLRSAGEF